MILDYMRKSCIGRRRNPMAKLCDIYPNYRTGALKHKQFYEILLGYGNTFLLVLI